MSAFCVSLRESSLTIRKERKIRMEIVSRKIGKYEYINLVCQFRFRFTFIGSSSFHLYSNEYALLCSLACLLTIYRITDPSAALIVQARYISDGPPESSKYPLSILPTIPPRPANTMLNKLCPVACISRPVTEATYSTAAI
ncbi:hypothetical protein D3C76_1529810 [compost metagenome]